MRLLKFFLTTSIIVLSVFFAQKVLAEAEFEKTLSNNAIVISRVNIQDAKIISQEGNELEISFDLNNREGAQSGIKYGVKLFKKEEKGIVLVDEYVYPEIISIAANESITKKIKYLPPSNTKEGLYEVQVSARVYSGMLIGTQALGEVSLGKQDASFEIIKETCSTRVEKAKTPKAQNLGNYIVVTKDDKIVLSCVVKNNTEDVITVSSAYKTFQKTLYGEEVSGLDAPKTTITLRALEEKIVDFPLPQISVPQIYVSKVFLESENGVLSNYIPVLYVVSGLSATIQNVSLDKNSYKSKEIAKIGLFWSPFSDNKDEIKTITYNIDIINKNNKSCLEKPTEGQMMGIGFIEIPAQIIRNCDEPEVKVSLLGSKGEILDQKSLIFKTANSPVRISVALVAFVVLLLVLVILLYFKNKKKNNKKDGDGSTKDQIGLAVIAVMFVLGLSFLTSNTASADVIYMDASGECYPGSCYSWEYIAITVYTDKATYSPGEYMTVYTVVEDKVPSWSNSAYSLWATVNSTRKGIVQGEYQMGYLHSNYFTTPSTSGGHYAGYDGFVSGFANGDVYFSGNLYYEITAPASTVDVTASNQQSLTVTSGTGVPIRWSTQNATSSTVCNCSISTGGSCGQSVGSSTNTTTYVSGTYTPLSTTTYTVTCNP